jgi:hypothetical protein
VEKANPSAAPAQKTAESLPARSGVASAWQHNSARFGSFASLQHALGNQALLGLLNSHRIQTKSRSGATDEFEAEADCAASAPLSLFSPKGVLLKKSELSTDTSVEPEKVRAQLESGSSLDTRTRGQMESAFGRDFSAVRVHTDSRAKNLSSRLNARAFTVGSDIGFAAGEYQPGTLVGDALLAHELAHVVQQRSSSGTTGPMQKSAAGSGYGALEEDADNAAVGAVASLWSHGWQGVNSIGPKAMPRMRSTLRLQRCNGSKSSHDAGIDAGVPPVASGPVAPPVTKTPGQQVTEKAGVFLSTESDVKTHTDVLKAALREISAGKAVGFNRDAGLKHIAEIANILGLDAAQKAQSEKDWEWLVDNRKTSSSAAYHAKKKSLFAAFRTPVEELGVQFPQSQAKFWLKNTPAQIADVVIKVSDADMPPLQVFAYGAKEGLVKYVRDDIGLAQQDDPTEAQLAGVKTDKSVSGFDYLGLDDIVTELSSKRHPLTEFLPADFDRSKTTDLHKINEKGRRVQSMQFPNLLMALQGMVAVLKRRRKLFLEDAKELGYATPTEDETVYWTYVYFNSGEFGGKADLAKHKGKRKLSDWITSKVYPNAIKLLESFQMLRKMNLFGSK